MEDREYIRKEAEMILNFILVDGEAFENMKQVYARIFNSIIGTCKWQIGGIENLELTKENIKDIIKSVVENSKREVKYF